MGAAVRAAVMLACAAIATGAHAQLAPQESARNGVNLAVTPIELGSAARTWSFRVVLDTHSQDLSDDLTAAAVLGDGKGREARPYAWEGAAPGGHHREGVLKFAPFDPVPDSVELRILRSGESAPRTFRWPIP